ncbi:MAG TPA: N-acetyltransferase family protein [Bacillota bacterium]|nr:N-acetyltransferase family protein [Bacillota bacterium]
MRDKACYTIRPASPDDAGAVLAIYAPFVTDTCISFETEVPALDAFRQRMRGIMAEYPYYVCEYEGKIVGYAYASKYSERRAYRYSADLTIYISPEHHGRGVGRLLYERLCADLRERGIYTVYACVTAENTTSLKFHTALGFVECGRFHNIGYKHGRWLDVVWLEKPVREYDTPAE